MVYPSTLSPPVTSQRIRSDLTDHPVGTLAQYLSKMQVLDNITSHIKLSYRDSSPSTAVQIDDCLNEFAKSLEPPVSMETIPEHVGTELTSQTALLRLR